MCKHFLYRNAFVSMCVNGMYSVKTQGVALLQIHT